MQLFYLKQHKNSGFTLVEILLAFTLLIVASTVGIIGYTQFNNSQKFNNAVADVAMMLEKAKSRAQNQVKPSSCTGTLSNYVVNFSGDVYTLIVNCPSPITLESKQLPTGITFSSAANFTFSIMDGAVTFTSGVTSVTLTDSSRSKTIEVSPVGIITVN